MNSRINIAVIGSLDHGKSTLIGRLLYNTKTLSEEKVKEIQKNKENLEFALFLDSFREEREHQFTLDTTQRILRAKKLEYNFIDCPGHKGLIKNMLSGISGAEYAILVISARLDEGVEEQTRIHINIAKLLDITKLFVAINKMDTVSYKEERFLEIKTEVKDYLRKVNFHKKTLFIPISAKEGENTTKRIHSMKWYKGKTLLSVLSDNIKNLSPKEYRPLSVLMQDIYSYQGKNYLLGKIERGLLRVNDWVFLNLSQQRGKVTEIIVNGKVKRASKEGDCIGATLEDINLDKVKRGEVISGLHSKPLVTNIFQGDIFFLDSRYKSNKRFLLRCGLKETSCKIDLLSRKEYIYKAQISLNEKVAIDNISKTPYLGRFILFGEKGEAVGLGVVNV
jgi:bifunctional enzyme CysN/CysC/sulfate adenylyltransferase subunit 1